jgi:DNA-binding CsgD family transcriptional regulator
VTTRPGDGWSALVERDGEREAVEISLAGSGRGHGRFVLVYGQSGIGRTSLLRAATEAAEANAHGVLAASGSDLERGYGFGVVRQLFEARIAGLGARRQRSLLTDAGPAAASALGIAASDVAAPSVGFDQIEGVYRLLLRLAAESPLIVAIDDLQWCDRPSLDFVCFLGHRVSQLPITLVAAWRRGEPGVKAGRLQALAGMPQTSFLVPAPLSVDGVRSVMTRELGSRPAEGAVMEVHAQTGGQPFLVAELVAGLQLRRVPVSADTRDAIQRVTPESVRRSVLARLGRHPEPVPRLARAVAVLEDASVTEAAAVAGIDRDRACAATAALVRAGIFRDESTVAFAQPLVRRALYDTLPLLERSELHRRAAGVLCESPARVGLHLLECEPVGDPRFANALREAALLAANDADTVSARRLYERALGEVDDPAAEVEILVSLAELELDAGELESSAGHALDALALASAPAQRVAASLVWAEATAGRANWRAAAERLEDEALALQKGERELELALLSRAAVLRTSAGAPAPRPSDRLGSGQLLGDTPAERAMLAAAAADMTLTGDGTAHDVAAICRRALAGRGGHADYLAGHAAVLADAGDLVEDVLAETEPDRDAAAGRLALQSQLALSRGDLMQAHAAAEDGLRLLSAVRGSSLRRRLRTDFLATIVLVALARGQAEHARQALARLEDATGEGPAITTVLAIAVALARSEPAVELAARAAGEPAGVVAPATSVRCWAALAHHAAGNEDRALALADDHVGFARRWGGASVLGRALVVRAVVGPQPERLDLLEEAVGVLSDSQARLEHAHAMVELGAALRRAGRRRDARTHLSQGGDLADRCGADALVERARAELVAAGARPRRAAFSGVSSLTDAELRVAVLAARGLTTRAIARELIVSPKTVSGQLGAVYSKLDVHDRAALAEAMQAVDGADARLEAVR